MPDPIKLLIILSDYSLVRKLNEANLGELFGQVKQECLETKALQFAHRPTHELKGLSYKLTYYNLIKMMLIVQRERDGIPIILMGEAGVGKTALIRFISEDVRNERLTVLNVHSGVGEQHVAGLLEQLSAREGKQWVFFDEFNTSEVEGYLTEILVDHRYKGQSLPANMVFMAACNPFKLREDSKALTAGLANPCAAGDLYYQVLPIGYSIADHLWNYSSLVESEFTEYVHRLLESDYKKQKLSVLIRHLHERTPSLNLRDVARFNYIFSNFVNLLPVEPPIHATPAQLSAFQALVAADRNARVLVSALNLAYLLRAEFIASKEEFIH